VCVVHSCLQMNARKHAANFIYQFSVLGPRQAIICDVVDDDDDALKWQQIYEFCVKGKLVAPNSPSGYLYV